MPQLTMTSRFLCFVTFVTSSLNRSETSGKDRIGCTAWSFSGIGVRVIDTFVLFELRGILCRKILDELSPVVYPDGFDLFCHSTRNF